MGFGNLGSTGSFFNVGVFTIGVGVWVGGTVSGVLSLVETGNFWVWLVVLVETGAVSTVAW